MTDGFSKACDKAGGIAGLADLLNITKPAIYQWKGRPPVKRCPEIERLTGVSCRDLRPDFFKKVNK